MDLLNTLLENFSGVDFITHYITLGYRLEVGDKLLKLQTEQHSRYHWMTIDQLLNHPNAHRHSKWYFESD